MAVFSASAFIAETEPAIRADLEQTRGKDLSLLPAWKRPLAAAIWGPLVSILIERIIRAVLRAILARYDLVPKGQRGLSDGG